MIAALNAVLTTLQNFQPDGSVFRVQLLSWTNIVINVSLTFQFVKFWIVFRQIFPVTETSRPVAVL